MLVYAGKVHIFYGFFIFFSSRFQVLPCKKLCAIRGFVNPSFSTDANDVKLVHIILSSNTAEPVFTHCSCTVGLRGDCSHVGALLFVVCDIVAEGLQELPADQTCTDVKCKWSDPKGANCEPKLVEELYIYKAKCGSNPHQLEKKMKPSACLADKVYSNCLNEDEKMVRRCRLKNDILMANKRDCLPPVFHLIEPAGTAPSSDEFLLSSSDPGGATLRPGAQETNPDQVEHQGVITDIDIPYSLEVTVEEEVSEPADKKQISQPKLPSHPTCTYNEPLSLTNIRERAERIKESLIVTDQEREMIEKQTRPQAKCEEWYKQRKTRITASKCKRAFIKATTSPTKAIKDIMGMNASVSTRFMKDGLASEPEIIQRKSVDFLYPKNILFLELPLMV